MADTDQKDLVASAAADAASVNEGEQKTGEQDSKPTFDVEALTRRIEEVSSGAASRAEVETLRRAAGHVPTLQSEVASLKAELAQRKGDADRLDALEVLLTTVLPADEAARIETQRAERTRTVDEDARFDALAARLEARLPKESTDDADDTPADPGIVAYRAAVAVATEQVHAYATELGIDPTDIPGEVYQKAQRDNGGDLVRASQAVIAWIDQQAEAASASARRATRAEDASGGDPSKRAGATGMYDLNTLSGLSQAKNAGAIDSTQFIEGWRRLRGGI